MEKLNKLGKNTENALQIFAENDFKIHKIGKKI